ncbi:MAG: type 1 glutamine amidotransferase domain-containing protein [Pseudomonadota bacterium]
MQYPSQILIVLTSHGTLGPEPGTGGPTGFWLEELATPYYVFKDAGAAVTLASPRGGKPPMDPLSAEPENRTDATRRFDGDEEAQSLLQNTAPLGALDPRRFDAVFYPGGHGPLWDLVDNADSIRLIEALWRAGKPVAAICHAPVVLLNARDEHGEYLVKNRRVTCFSNKEEAAVGMTEAVPLLVENALSERGGLYSSAPDFEEHAVRDGRLICGQNPASSAAAARLLLDSLQ